MQTPAEKELAALWESLAHKVLASVLVDDGAVFPVLDVLGQGLHWWPPKAARAWAGVLQCVEEGVPPSLEAVKLRSGCTDGYLQVVANGWNDEDNRRVAYNAEELKRLGALAELRRLGRELLDVTDPGDVAGQIDYAGNRLSGIMAVTSNRKGDARAVSASAWEQVGRMQGTGIRTGLPWFDGITGGLWPGMNYWIVAAYKMGKTTLMRNLVLNALADGHAVDVYCAEGSREMFALDCQAMIATQTLCERGWRLADLRLSGLFILRVWRDQLPTLKKGELEAIEAARKTWEGYDVRVWDTRDGVRNLAALKHRVRQSKFDHGSLVHWGDYSQLFASDRGGTLYERQSRVALAVEEIAQAEGVMFGMLSQRNEAAIRDGSGYSVGVKGGGDASAAADVLLLPRIDHDVKGRMEVVLKYSRHTGTGKGAHVVNVTSGLIVDRWFPLAPPLALGG